MRKLFLYIIKLNNFQKKIWLKYPNIRFDSGDLTLDRSDYDFKRVRCCRRRR
jgi:hypothetical protein